MVACFVPKAVSSPVICDVGKLGICAVAKVPDVIFAVSSEGICVAVSPVIPAPAPAILVADKVFVPLLNVRLAEVVVIPLPLPIIN
jgi:hypothetical protein